MAYWINQAGNNNRANWRSFYADTDTDVQSLPTSKSEGDKQTVDPTAHKRCSIGSECISLSSSKVFILGSDNIWKEI